MASYTYTVEILRLIITYVVNWRGIDIGSYYFHKFIAELLDLLVGYFDTNDSSIIYVLV